MIVDVTMGKGDINDVWKKIINKISKEYNLTEKETQELNKFDIISLSSEIFEITYQKTKNMVGMLINPISDDDYNIIKLFIITNDDDIIEAVVKNDKEVYNKVYNTFLTLLDDGSGADISFELNDNILPLFWKYFDVFNYLNYATIKYNKLQVEEKQDTENGRVTLQRKWLFAITKHGTIIPLIEYLAMNTQKAKHDQGYF